MTIAVDLGRKATKQTKKEKRDRKDRIKDNKNICVVIHMQTGNHIITSEIHAAAQDT